MQSDTVAQVSLNFNAADADIILRSAAKDAESSPSGEAENPVDFRVHKKQLARLSIVLADMLDLGHEGEMERSGELPVVCLEEGAIVVEAMLRYTADDIDLFPDLDDTARWIVIGLWDASMKYRITAIQYATELDIRKRLPKYDVDDCCAIYARSIKFHRPILRALAVKRLGAIPVAGWSAKHLSIIDPNGILIEMSKRDHIKTDLDGIVKRTAVEVTGGRIVVGLTDKGLNSLRASLSQV